MKRPGNISAVVLTSLCALLWSASLAALPVFVDAPVDGAEPGSLSVERGWDAAQQRPTLRLRHLSPGGTLSALVLLHHVTLVDVQHPGDASGLEAEDGLRWSPGGGQLAMLWVGARGERDEVTVVLELGENPSTASVSLVVVDGQHAPTSPGAWPEGDPLERLIVGSADVDVVPDDGVYLDPKVVRLRLTHESLDIEPVLLNAGRLRPGMLGRVAMPIRSCGEPREGSRDHHGASPMRCTQGLENLGAEVRPLRGAEDAITASSIQVDLPSGHLPAGSLGVGDVQVQVPSGLRGGLYQGMLVIFEDNNGNGFRDVDDPFDTVHLEVVVMRDDFDGVWIPPTLSPGPDGSNGTETEADPRYLRGGEQPLACSALSPRGGSGVPMEAGLALLLVAGLLLGRRRVAGLVGGLLLVAAGGGEAEAQEVDIDRLTGLSMAADRQVVTDFGRTLGHGEFAFRASSMYSHQPLTFFDDEGLVDVVVERRLEHALVASFGLFDVLEVQAALPLISYQEGGGLGGQGMEAFALGDLRLGVRAAVFPERWTGFARAALMAQVAVPLDREAAWSSAGEPRVDLGMVVAGGSSVLEVALNLGMRLQPETEQLANLVQGNELRYSLGVSWNIVDSLAWSVELPGATRLVDPFADVPHSPLEAFTSLRWTSAMGVSVLAGAGTSVVAGYGVPSWRALVSVDYRSGFAGMGGGSDTEVEVDPGLSRDSDRDGFVDAVDSCPGEPEDVDGWEDEDGCPDLDNDGDGIADLLDGAPNHAEDVDGWEDDDGIPEPDNDFDGVEDGRDICPLKAEDPDGHWDSDGCPDEDNDGDGVYDANDACPMTSGSLRWQGCPRDKEEE